MAKPPKKIKLPQLPRQPLPPLVGYRKGITQPKAPITPPSLGLPTEGIKQIPFWQKPLGQAARGALTKGGTTGLLRGGIGAVTHPYVAAAAAAPFAYSMFQEPIQKMWGLADWQAYRDAGGRMKEAQWKQAGSPKTPQDVGGEDITTARTRAITKQGGVTQADLMALPLDERSQWIQDQITARQLSREEEGDEYLPAVRWETISQGGWDYQISYDKNGNVVGQRELGRTERPAAPETPAQRAEREHLEALTGQIGKPQEPYKHVPWGEDPYEEGGQFNPITGEWEPPAGWISPTDKARIAAEQERLQLERDVHGWQRQVQEEEIKARKEAQLAQLRANPASWLEYASLSGQTPLVQPWMMPMMPQQYQGLTPGSELPGYRAGGTSMNLPELTRPSAQYMSRLSPSMRQQYGGYEQARTGQRPEDIEWQMWTGSPPGGRFGGLRRLG